MSESSYETDRPAGEVDEDQPRVGLADVDADAAAAGADVDDEPAGSDFFDPLRGQEPDDAAEAGVDTEGVAVGNADAEEDAAVHGGERPGGDWREDDRPAAT
jgi:hypothetical protein